MYRLVCTSRMLGRIPVFVSSFWSVVMSERSVDCRFSGQRESNMSLENKLKAYKCSVKVVNVYASCIIHSHYTQVTKENVLLTLCLLGNTNFV